MRIYRATRLREFGLTYLGVMIFIAVLGITTTSALTLGALVERRMAEEELLFVGEQYRAALESYYRATPAGTPRYPMTLQDLLRDPRYPNVRRHLRKAYLDPLTSRDDWVLVPAPGGGFMGLHSASVRVPIKIANFPLPFQAFADKDSYADWVFFYSPELVPRPPSAPSLFQANGL